MLLPAAGDCCGCASVARAISSTMPKIVRLYQVPTDAKERQAERSGEPRRHDSPEFAAPAGGQQGGDRLLQLKCT